MKITCSSKIQSLILAAALSIGLGFVSLVVAQEHYERSYILDSNGKVLTELGTLDGDYSYAAGINDAGRVAGWAHTATDTRAGMTDLGSPSAGPHVLSKMENAL